ncbi:hypothetical protein NIIDMKKI_38070 [Mycobacterium kansasii]|uniref:Uncharacterized protein n=1 Tax=Mycobacterium kansasii TaxID=1768 RepID=A0A7G1IC00_MYCKA|nr:hypothetical protein NIIDMKKI_38070 [Mycobacterium kansasii]
MDVACGSDGGGALDGRSRAETRRREFLMLLAGLPVKARRGGRRTMGALEPVTADVSVGAGDLVDQGALIVGEFFPGCAAPSGRAPLRRAHRGAAGSRGALGVHRI